MRVVVVGDGFSGLSTACQLVGSGHEVVVLERAPTPGAAPVCSRPTATASTRGRPVLTMVDLLSDTFAAAGADIVDHHVARVDRPVAARDRNDVPGENTITGGRSAYNSRRGRRQTRGPSTSSSGSATTAHTPMRRRYCNSMRDHSGPRVAREPRRSAATALR